MSLADKKINSVSWHDEDGLLFRMSDIREAVKELKEFITPFYPSDIEILKKIDEIFGEALTGGKSWMKE